MELTELCAELRNWFDKERRFGKYEISDGEIVLPFLQEGQYFRIVDSVFNDGVYQYPTQGLNDEVFEGAIWAMAVPPAVIALLDEINEWENTYKNVILSPYTSESFGGYSYAKASGSGQGNNTNDMVDYRSVFANKLNKWRKI